MAAAQPAYDYSAYDYSYDTSSAAAYAAYPGYESSAAYAAPGAYDGYAASAAYHTGPHAASSYATVDPYAGYPATAYAYPGAATAPGHPPATASQAAYASAYPSAPSNGAYAYESRRPSPPPQASASAPSAAAHYATYDYNGNAAGAYAMTPSSGAAYPSYKGVTATNGSAASNAYPTYVSSAAPHHGAYGVAPNSHVGGVMAPPHPSHVYPGAPPPPAASMAPRRPDYYPPPSPAVAHPMQYVHQAPAPIPYRLPPRGGYQRELDEPGDENALLRHVIYVTGLPKEIQNETLAEVFGASCGPIAPVDVRSPKPKIWVYKDRQTREGKGEATITFINPDSAQMAINYFSGKEMFGREIRVTLCPRRMYNMQKQNTPFNPAAPTVSTTTPISSMIKTIATNNNGTVPVPVAAATTAAIPSAASNAISSTTAAVPTPASSSSSVTTAVTTTASSNLVSAANPIATISSSTLGLPRQLNHSLFKLRQTPEQQRGLLPTPPMHFGGPMMGNALPRDGVRKELPRIALTRGNYVNSAGVRPKPY